MEKKSPKITRKDIQAFKITREYLREHANESRAVFRRGLEQG
jgi:hypothetical protein